MARLSLLPVFFQVALTEKSPEGCQLHGMAYTQEGLNVMPNGAFCKSAEICQDICSLTLYCHYFTWYEDSKGCWLLGNQAVLHPQPNATSGPRRCGDMPTASTVAPAAAPAATVAPPAVAANVSVTKELNLSNASALQPGNFSNRSYLHLSLSTMETGRAAITMSPRPLVLDDAGPAKASINGSNPSSLAASPRGNGFDYHKEPFPLDWRHDGLTLLLASLGLIVAASGGIGGGGILVPLFMLALEFKPKHAIALSNFTILGGAIANTLANVRRKHPHRDGPIIDWDLILAMEPLTIFGAVFGSLLSKILPNFVLTSLLVVILALIGQRTLSKGCSMFREESRTLRPTAVEVEMSPRHGECFRRHQGASLAEPEEDVQDYMAFQSDGEELTNRGAASGSSASSASGRGSSRLCCKIGALTLCFVGTCALTLLKGGGRMASPLGFECGSMGFWLLYFGAVPWVLAFAIGFRRLLVSEFKQKVQQGYSFTAGEVRWDSRNTVLYPLLCAIAGLLAGLFGVGGGIVKGPLMLEMGITPSVASASAAAMILYTSAAASTSFLVFGLLHPYYGAMFFLLGVVCTAVGQYVVGRWVHKQNRQSPIVLSIGTVICLSSIFVAVNTVAISEGQSRSELLAFHGVCDSAA